MSEKQSAGKKGKYIKSFGLTMAEYLLAEANLSIEERREVFFIQCRTNPLPANLGITEYCTSGEILSNSHIFKCNNLNEPRHEFEFEKVLNTSIIEIKADKKRLILTMRAFKQKYKKTLYLYLGPTYFN